MTLQFFFFVFVIFFSYLCNPTIIWRKKRIEHAHISFEFIIKIIDNEIII